MSKSILIFACIFSMCVKPPEHVALSDQSVEVYADTIRSDDLKVLSIGGFYYQKLVEKLYLDLEYKGVLSDSAAEKRITKYVSGLLAHINGDASLHGFLVKDVFHENDISVSLSYTSEEGKPSQVHVYNHEVIYSTYKAETNEMIKNYTVPLNTHSSGK